MTDLPSTSVWSTIGSVFLDLLEGASPISVVDPDPTMLTPLPSVLGGAAADLAAQAAEPQAFLELLRAKAHYFLLPAALVEQIRDVSSGVMFAGVGVPSPAPVSTTVLLGADMPAYLTVLGAELGRGISNSNPGPLGELYGELCRVWLQIAAGEPRKALQDAGISQYQNAATADGGVDSAEAWPAAAAGYVATRVQQWFVLLTALSNAASATDQSPSQRSKAVDDACAAYDAAFDQTVYGRVDGSPLTQPPMSAELRAMLDEHLLGLNALTCHFANTPLVGIAASLKAMPVHQPFAFNPEVKKLIAATALAEASWTEGTQQELDIVWIYINLIQKMNGIEALNRSVAYKETKNNYKVALYIIGDQRYAGDKVGKSYGMLSGTVKNQVDHGAGMTQLKARAVKLSALLDRIIDGQETNPYPGWIGQGNGKDINRDDSKWKPARAYWWIQKQDSTAEKWVKRLDPDTVDVGFIFHEEAILKYFKTHPLPAEVKRYKPGED
jgi:hypothetical protein